MESLCQVAGMNLSCNSRISSFNGRCRVLQSSMNRHLRSCLIVRSTAKIHINKFKIS
jgi:hypothetical protein